MPQSSGPRCEITSRMRVTRRGASKSSRSEETRPAMPHIVGSGPLRRQGSCARRSRGAVDELPKPELQHQQTPQAVPMVLPACAMFAPEAGDGRWLEDPAIVEPAVLQEIVDEFSQWTAKPLGDRDREPLLGTIDD